MSTTKPTDLTLFLVDCGGSKRRARAGCHCLGCEVRREEYRIKQREYRRRTQDANTKRYEKTPKGYLMRSYRNMKSRVEGIQKPGTWTGKDLLPREEFYDWALNDPTFKRLFAAYEGSGYERRLAPSPDRIDPAKGYTLDNMRWLTMAENSSLGSKSQHRALGHRLKDAA